MEKSSLQLLIMEDEKAHLDAICRYLKNKNFEIYCADSLSEAKRMLQKITPTLVLADINLKDGSALELLTTPKEDMPFPVIIMTSYGDEKIAVQAMKSGAIDYVVKSSESFAMLPQIIDAALREWQLLKSQKEAMQLISKREREFASLAENLPAIIARVSTEKKLLYANPAFIDCWLSEPVHKSTVSNYYLYDLKLLTPIAEVLDDMLRISIDTITNSFRQIDIEKENNKICYDVLAIPEKNLDTQKVESVLIIAFDVTFHKEAEETIRESELRFKKLAELMPACIAEVNKDGVITYMNQNGIRLFGYSEEEIIKGEIKFQNLFIVSERERINTLLKEKSTAKYLRSYEYKAMLKDGRPLSVLLKVSPLGQRDSSGKICCLILDISDQKSREEQMLEASKLVTLGTLVAGVAHEINNPTQFITMNAPIMKELTSKLLTEVNDVIALLPKNSPTTQYYTQHIEEIIKDIQTLLDGITAGGARIARIVEELRTYARPSDGGITQLLDIRQVIQSAITLLSNTIKQKTTRFSTHFDNSIPLIKGNHQKLEQVIINIIQNSCDALPSPTSAIWVRAGTDSETNEVFVEVRDEGIGIPPNILNRIFDPFFTTKREQGGMGLGLAISQRIVQEHGGKFTVVSTPGIGTMVKVSLPAAEVYAEVEMEQQFKVDVGLIKKEF